MNKLNSFFHRHLLTVAFTIIIFLFMFFSMLLVFVGAYFLYRFGIISPDSPVTIVLLLFALISLFTVLVLSILCSRFPLAPIQSIADAVDRIADGDYSARIDLKVTADLREFSKKFNHMAEELGSVELLRNDFINNFSHEFKTPIASIQGFAEMLEYDDLTPEEQTEYIHIIIEESARLAELAANILNLSKIEQQSILTNQTFFNVSEQIRQVIALLDKKWSEKDISVSFDCEECYLSGNEELLKQAWINLIDNAIKFSPDHENIDINIKKTTQDIIFSYANKGDPIPPAMLPHIFDKFYQVDASRTTSGNGLGLAIVRKIIELHGGLITVSSAASVGTIFEITLPQV